MYLKKNYKNSICRINKAESTQSFLLFYLFYAKAIDRTEGLRKNHSFGKSLCSGYRQAMRYCVRDGTGCTEKNKRIAKNIKGIFFLSPQRRCKRLSFFYTALIIIYLPYTPLKKILIRIK